MIVLNKSRCHFDEMLTGHRNEVLISFFQRSLILARFFLCLGPLIQGRSPETVSNMFQSISNLYQFSSATSGMECNIFCLRT